MRHINYILILVLSLVAMFSGGCSEQIYDNAGIYKPSLDLMYLKVADRDFTFGSEGGTKTTQLKCNNAWLFNDVPFWLSVSPTSGDSDAEVSLESSSNNTLSNRTAVFSVSSVISDIRIRKTLTAVQAVAEPFFEFENLGSNSLYFTGKDQSIVINVHTNLEDLKLTTVGDDTSWLRASYGNGSISVHMDENRQDVTRSASVRLWSDRYSKGGIIYITQNRPNISFGEMQTLLFGTDGGKTTVQVNSELSWNAKTDATWLTISPTSGNEGVTNLTVTALPSYQNNDRTARINFSYTDDLTTENYITVTQQGYYINTSTNLIQVAAEGVSGVSIIIDSNVEWIVSEKPEWVTLNPETAGAGTSNISFGASANNSIHDREGKIKIIDKKTGSLEKTISVMQSGMEFGGIELLELDWHKTTVPITIKAAQSWNVEISDGWLSLSQYSGTGETTVDVNVSRNDSEDTRNATIKITTEGEVTEIPVVQTGQYLHLNNSSGQFDALGGEVSLDFNSSINTEWSIDYGQGADGWVSVDDTKQNTFLLKVGYNKSTNGRAATFIVMPTDDEVSETFAQGVKFAISQKGRRLTCDVDMIVMSPSGGTSQIYNISCDGPYQIRKVGDDSWYSLIADVEAKTFYVILTENRTQQKRLGKIEISLIDLPEGESMVREVIVAQAAPEINISFDNFSTDETW